MARLNDLLRDLGSDAELEEAFRRDPESVMSQYGIAEAERDALRREDVAAVSRLSGQSDIALTNGTIKGYA